MKINVVFLVALCVILAISVHGKGAAVHKREAVGGVEGKGGYPVKREAVGGKIGGITKREALSGAACKREAAGGKGGVGDAGGVQTADWDGGY